MSKSQRMVREFHDVMGCTVGGTPAIRDAQLRARLILEEAIETVTAIIGTASAATLVRCAAFDAMHADEEDPTGPDLVKAIDGLCDLEYVSRGTAVSFVVDLDPFFKVVHQANMRKASGPIDAHGKRLKPPGFVPPDGHIRNILIALGWVPPTT